MSFDNLKNEKDSILQNQKISILEIQKSSENEIESLVNNQKEKARIQYPITNNNSRRKNSNIGTKTQNFRK